MKYKFGFDINPYRCTYVSKFKIRLANLSADDECRLRMEKDICLGYYDIFAYKFVETDRSGISTEYKDTKVIRQFLTETFHKSVLLDCPKVIKSVNRFFPEWANRKFKTAISPDNIVILSLEQAENPIGFDGYFYEVDNTMKNGFSNRGCMDFHPEYFHVAFAIYRFNSRNHDFQHIAVSQSSYDLASLFEESIDAMQAVRNHDEYLETVFLSLGMDERYLAMLSKKNYEIVFLCDNLGITNFNGKPHILHEKYTFSNLLLLDVSAGRIYNIDLVDLKEFLDGGMVKEYRYCDFDMPEEEPTDLTVSYDYSEDTYFEDDFNDDIYEKE